MATTKAGYGIVGVLCVLLGFGGNVALTAEQASHVYLCPTTQNIGIFEKLSSTGKVGYYTNDLGKQASSSCSVSWVKLNYQLPARKLKYSCGVEVCTKLS